MASTEGNRMAASPSRGGMLGWPAEGRLQGRSGRRGQVGPLPGLTGTSLLRSLQGLRTSTRRPRLTICHALGKRAW